MRYLTLFRDQKDHLEKLDLQVQWDRKGQWAFLEVRENLESVEEG